MAERRRSAALAAELAAAACLAVLTRCLRVAIEVGLPGCILLVLAFQGNPHLFFWIVGLC